MSGKNAGGLCGCYTIILLLNLALGGFCFDYSLYAILGKNVPWFVDMIAGLFLGEITIPLAVVCWCLSWCLPIPFIS